MRRIAHALLPQGPATEHIIGGGTEHIIGGGIGRTSDMSDMSDMSDT